LWGTVQIISNARTKVRRTRDKNGNMKELRDMKCSCYKGTKGTKWKSQLRFLISVLFLFDVHQTAL
jgi:hypothetical protein